MRPASTVPFLVLGIALLAVSHGAIFARLAEAESLAIAAWRMGLAALVVVPFAFGARHEARRAPGRAFVLAAASGLFLALHFATWIASLERTTIARSVLLVSTAPIWVAVIQFVLGRRVPARPMVLALMLATGGAVVVSSAGIGPQVSIAGDLLAVAGGVAMAGYLLLSRESQSALPFRAYLAVAYGSAAALLWLAMGFTGTPAVGYGAGTWWALAGMALVSQLVGHSGYNWSLRHLSPLFVAVVLIGEPVLASLLGWWLIGEQLDWRTAAGGVLILAGIAFGALAARERR